MRAIALRAACRVGMFSLVDDEVGMPNVDGKLVSTADRVSVENYGVRADLFLDLSVEPDGGESTSILAPISGSARAAADGTFRIAFDIESTGLGVFRF